MNKPISFLLILCLGLSPLVSNAQPKGAGTAPPAPEPLTVIRAGKFIDVERGRELSNQIIVIRGRKIEAVGPIRSRRRFGRAKWDAQPTQPAAVLIATVGVSVPQAVIRRACELSAGRQVAVLSIARIYGSSLGMPNPGLLPSKREMAEQLAFVSEAIDELERSGVEASGQVATTRRMSAPLCPTPPSDRQETTYAQGCLLAVAEPPRRWPHPDVT